MLNSLASDPVLFKVLSVDREHIGDAWAHNNESVQTAAVKLTIVVTSDGVKCELGQLTTCKAGAFGARY
jgi:hypothetical protein